MTSPLTNAEATRESRAHWPDPADVQRVRSRLAEAGEGLSASLVASTLRGQGRPVGDRTVLAILDLLRTEVSGAGPLQELLSTPGVTDVLVNGPREVYLDRGQGLERVQVAFTDEAAVRRLAQRLASLAGRRLDDASPYVDVRLPDSTRLHAVLAPMARPGTLISLRVPRRRVFSLSELVAAGSLSIEMSQVLATVVRSRRSFLVSGGTGAGKTTVLNTLLSLGEAGERLVIVEDTAELAPDHRHVVALEARPANIEGTGGIELQTLVRQALRMRPDRLVVGEVRGAEVTDLLAALNTGHEGGCGTIHANSAADVPVRIEGLGWAAGLPAEATHAQVGTGLDVVVHCRREADGRRRVAEIAVVTPVIGGRVSTETALVTGRDGETSEGPGAARLAALLGR